MDLNSINLDKNKLMKQMVIRTPPQDNQNYKKGVNFVHNPTFYLSDLFRFYFKYLTYFNFNCNFFDLFSSFISLSSVKINECKGNYRFASKLNTFAGHAGRVFWR